MPLGSSSAAPVIRPGPSWCSRLRRPISNFRMGLTVGSFGQAIVGAERLCESRSALPFQARPVYAGVPAASDVLQQWVHGPEEPVAHREQVAFAAERGGLRDHHAEVTHRARTILVERDFEVALCGLQGLALELGLTLKLVGEHQVVFDFLQCRQHGLAVRGRGPIGCGPRLGTRKLALAAVEDGFGQRASERPQQVRCAHQLGERRAAISRIRRPCQVGKERGIGDADLRIGRRHSALRRSDVGSAFEQRRRQHLRHHWRWRQDRVAFEPERRRCHAQQHCNGMLELGSLRAQVGGLRLRGLELGLRLQHVGARRHATVVANLRQVQRALIRRHAALDERGLHALVLLVGVDVGELGQ